MPRIEIRTVIKADKKLVFDLSRSIDLHQISTAHTNEKAVAGRMSGLIGLDESVTWKAKHFGFYQTLTSKITEFETERSFTDEMVSGAFEFMRHEHHFFVYQDSTLMVDFFNFRSPLGLLGEWVDRLFLKKYMTSLLEKRNATIKDFAESDKWRDIISVEKV